MIYLVYTVHVLVCIFLILVVLLQQGKGADLSVFGGGSTQTAFGAVGATSLLHKLTVGSFIVFILTTVTIAVTQVQHGDSRSVVTSSAAQKAKGEEKPKATEGKDEATAPATPAAQGSAAETPAPGQAAEGPAMVEAPEKASAESGSAQAGAEPAPKSGEGGGSGGNAP